jgi:hypothetical protein
MVDLATEVALMTHIRHSTINFAALHGKHNHATTW